jgi:hypothetical protein
VVLHPHPVAEQVVAGTSDPYAAADVLLESYTD